MLYTGKQIVARIRRHIQRRGNVFASWTVGTSQNARTELFERHQVQRTKDKWILMHATSPAAARKAQAFLTEKLGTVTHKAPRDTAADYVYAYRRSPTTDP